MNTQYRPAFTIFALLTIITGVIYPLVVTGIAQITFPHQVNGSLIMTEDGQAVGSELIGQQFDDPKYFWGRPSAANYNAALSSGSNYGPMNPALMDMVQTRIDALRATDPDNTLPIPVGDLALVELCDKMQRGEDLTKIQNIWSRSAWTARTSSTATRSGPSSP